MNSNIAPDMDPILLAVIANRFEAIVREVSNTLFRTGRSAILNTAKDFSCCIVTADNQVLSSADGLPVHVLGSGLQTQYMQEFHADMAAGDAYLHNDPYLGNTHAGDHTILAPVFIGGEHLFTVASKAHQADCGNSDPSTMVPFAKDVYHEGSLTFPCVRIQRGYEDVGDVVRMCQKRIRVPDVWYGDYLAALGSVRIGERRLKALVDKYGVATVKQFVREWLNYSERRTEQAIRRLPAGRLRSSSRHDALPGLPDGININVTVEIVPEQGCVHVDLTDNPDCVPLGMNLSEACATSAALIGVLNCIDSTIPRNAGSFRRVKVKLRENCCAGIPRFPASCSMATSNLCNRVINATQFAFSQLGDGYGLAEGGASMGVGFGVLSGNDRRRGGVPFVNMLVIGNNGGPGSPRCDGWVCYAMPDSAASVLVDSVEIIEQKYPVLIRASRLLPDTAGPGRFRGAPAGEVIYGPLHDPMTVAYFAEMSEDAPKGAQGGLSGSRAFAAKINRHGDQEPLPPIGLVELQPGEWIRGAEAGGGGYGLPRERAQERVLHDVLEGWVSKQAAEEIYGIRFTGSREDESLAIAGRS
jgi:N-methylhydantoinase B